MDKLLTPSEIAGYTEGLRRLALSLVRDAAAADDAVQDTLVQALRTPPRRGPTTTAWFHTVLRHAVRRRWRSDARRQRREATQEPAAPAEGPATRMERTEMAEAVIAALRAVPAAQREALELRYLQARKPAAIAAQLGVPVETVKTRIKRGREAMRAELDREHRGAWVPGFVCAFGFDAATVLGAAKAGLAVPAIVLLLVFAGIGLWLLADARDSDATPDDAASVIESPAEGEAPTDAGPTLGVRPATSAVPAGSRTEDDGKASPASKDPDTVVRDAPGRVLVTDATGRTVTVSRATLHYRMLGPGDGRPHDVPVHGGQFVLQLQPRQRPEFHSLTWEGGVAVVTEPLDPVSEPFAEPMVVRARAVDDVLVHVLDAATGESLTEICWLRTDRERDHLCHPGPGAQEDLNWGSSPLRIRAQASDLRGESHPLLIGAPGHGWEAVAWNPKVGEPVRVELERAGRVHIHTPGPTLRHRAYVRVRATDRPGVGYRAFWNLEPNGRCVLDGLPAGSYTARVEIGKWFSRPKVLAEQSFTLGAGDAPELTLAYEAPARVRAVPVRGTFQLGAGWTIEKRLFLQLRRLGPSAAGDARTSATLQPGQGLERDAEHPNRYRMDAGLLQPGRYQVSLHEAGYIGLFEVPEDGNDELEIRIPPPVAVHVHVEGDVRGREPFLRQITWNGLPPKDFRSYGSREAKRASRDEPFVFQAPAGRISIRPSHYVFQAEQNTFEIQGESQRIVLRVHPNARMHLIAKHEGKALRWNWAWPVEVEGVGYDAVLGPRSLLEDRRGFWITVDRPGRVRVRVGPIPGYEPLPERVVDAVPHKPIVLTYELTPRR